MGLQKETEKVVELCRNLVRRRSYSGEEQNVAALLQETLKQGGFDSVTTDGYGSVIAEYQGARPGKTILFDGHMDTVPVPDESMWTYPPFAGEIHDGKLYGRGTSDMKGAVAAYTRAAVDFIAEHGRDFSGKIVVDGIVEEECFEGIASRSVSAIVMPDIVVIGEASDCNLKIGQRGRAELIVETHGTSCHSSNPEKGNNAVYQMTEVIRCLREIRPAVHPFLGKGILELVDIKSSPYPGASVVPDKCRVTYDRRLLVGETKDSVLAQVQTALDSLMKEQPWIHATVRYASGREICYTGREIAAERFFPGWLNEDHMDMIHAIAGRMQQRGHSPEITKYSFCTNGSHYAGEAGINTFGLGPSSESLAHTVDEYVSLEQLSEAYWCYIDVLETILR